MLSIDNVEVVGFRHAVLGMRNSHNSWDKSDSIYGNNICFDSIDGFDGFFVRNPYNTQHSLIFRLGENDLALMKSLSRKGSDERKFMRMIDVYLDVTAPLYWWKEFDTYKVGTVSLSCSTMHTIHKRNLELSDFSCDRLYLHNIKTVEAFIDTINFAREDFVKTGDKQDWEQIIQMLPSSFNQLRTLKVNYEVLANIYKSRHAHRLKEWRIFCEWIAELPYSELITQGVSLDGSK